MAVAITLAYYDTPTITVVKTFIVGPMDVLLLNLNDISNLYFLYFCPLRTCPDYWIYQEGPVKLFDITE